MTDKSTVLSQLPPLYSPVWLRGGNVQTLYAKLLQSPTPSYRRELLPDSTGTEQVAYDFIDSDDVNAPLVIHFHGLEGSSESHYAIELMNAVKARRWHGVVAHFRSCGGVPAKKLYHSGDTVEVAHMLKLMAARYRTIYAVGVSLGGNVLAKYLGEQGKKNAETLINASAVISAPVDLMTAGRQLEHGLVRLIYTPYFLKSLLKKVKREPVLKLRSLGDFDDAYTAPMHGFLDKEDYYRQSSAKTYLKNIQIPTLLINAQNDPFFSVSALPTENEVSELVYLLQPKNGGHVGFVGQGGFGHLQWLPETALVFFELVTVL